MHIAISGSSGLIGTALTARLRAAGHTVRPLVRREAHEGEITWDPARGVLAPDALAGVDAVVNLAGAGIGDHRWTDAYKQELRDSRLRSTELLSETIALTDAAQRPSVLLSGSAIGYYGDRGEQLLDESSGPGNGFLSRLCIEWEAATAPAADAGVRVVHLRTGIVLAAHGGALKKQLPLFKLGLGGWFGSGRQWQSWITLADEVGAIEHLLTSKVTGAVNLTAPDPVTNRELARTLARVLHRPAMLPIPGFAPKLVLGAELVDAVLLAGQRVVPRVLEADGYEFRQPALESALRSVLAG